MQAILKICHSEPRSGEDSRKQDTKRSLTGSFTSLRMTVGLLCLSIQFFIHGAGEGFVPRPEKPGLAVCGLYQNKGGTGGVQPQL